MGVQDLLAEISEQVPGHGILDERPMSAEIRSIR
jgi:hypothetical protein